MSESEMLEQLYQRISNNISYFRNKENLKQEALANELGIGQSLVSQYETGKKRPNLEMINRICSYFKVSLHDMLFMDFSNKQTRETENLYTLSASDEIQKCANRTYYCYYLKVQNGGSLGQEDELGRFDVKIGTAIGTHKARATINFPKKKSNNNYSAILEMDEKYAYLSCHDFKKDFFLHLTFYYYRSSESSTYRGGVGLLQFMDHNDIPISQYCIISVSEIGNIGNQEKLKKFLKTNVSSDSKPSALRFVSSGILRLTKKHDEEVFGWMKNKGYAN